MPASTDRSIDGPPRPSRLFWTLNKFVNPVVKILLRSPAGRLVGKRLALLRLRGRKSGKVIGLPVEYAREGDRVVVVPVHPERKQWWRNLRQESEVRIRIGGGDHRARAVAIIGHNDPEGVKAALETYLGRYPKHIGAMGLDDDWRERMPGAVANLVAVEIRLDSAEST